MLLTWFKAGNKDDPDSAVISAQIIKEHKPLELLKRIFIRPFLKREDRR